MNEKFNTTPLSFTFITKGLLTSFNSLMFQTQILFSVCKTTVFHDPVVSSLDRYEHPSLFPAMLVESSLYCVEFLVSFCLPLAFQDLTITRPS